MKKVIALILAGLLCLTAVAFAAEWKEGRGPAQPYDGVPEVDLEKTMGYILLCPSAKLPAKLYSDRLQIFLPREDVELKTGKVTIYDDEGEFATMDVSDENVAAVRPMTEAELGSVIWGGGVCVEIRLPISLTIGKDYYVKMEAGIFSAADGKVTSLPVENDTAWKPVVQGDYGVCGLYYSAPVDAEAEESEEEAEIEYVTTPKAGDTVTFDLMLGGDAKYAVIFSDDASVTFEDTEYSESTTVVGTVAADKLDWGVVFLDDAGEMLEIVNLDR